MDDHNREALWIEVDTFSRQNVWCESWSSCSSSEANQGASALTTVPSSSQSDWLTGRKNVTLSCPTSSLETSVKRATPSASIALFGRMSWMHTCSMILRRFAPLQNPQCSRKVFLKERESLDELRGVDGRL